MCVCLCLCVHACVCVCVHVCVRVCVHMCIATCAAAENEMRVIIIVFVYTISVRTIFLYYSFNATQFHFLQCYNLISLWLYVYVNAEDVDSPAANCFCCGLQNSKNLG